MNVYLQFLHIYHITTCILLLNYNNEMSVMWNSDLMSHKAFYINAQNIFEMMLLHHVQTHLNLSHSKHSALIYVNEN